MFHSLDRLDHFLLHSAYPSGPSFTTVDRHLPLYPSSTTDCGEAGLVCHRSPQQKRGEDVSSRSHDACSAKMRKAPPSQCCWNNAGHLSSPCLLLNCNSRTCTQPAASRKELSFKSRGTPAQPAAGIMASQDEQMRWRQSRADLRLWRQVAVAMPGCLRKDEARHTLPCSVALYPVGRGR